MFMDEACHEVATRFWSLPAQASNLREFGGSNVADRTPSDTPHTRSQASLYMSGPSIITAFGSDVIVESLLD
jgi:hypothetical protein